MCGWTSVNGLTVYLRRGDQESREAGKFVRMCMALPLLPPEQIQPAFNELRRSAERRPFYNTMVGFLDYVQRTWLDSKYYLSA